MDKDIIVSWMEAGMIQVPNLLMQKYKQIGLDEKELALLLHILSFIEAGNEFPTPEQLAGRMTINSSECSGLLRKLVQMQILSIEEGLSEDGIRFEKYSLSSLWARLADELKFDKKQNGLKHTLLEEHDLYTLFEQEFGRPLSPMECENLAMWLDDDGQDPVIIKAALREAVLAGKLSFRYIDRILFNWKRNGVRTLEQARMQGIQFRQKTKQPAQPATETTSKTIPVYNWLEP
ncbi:DnaD domain-containing protein [Siminovitchia fortis]|uniref:DnaD domain protein n=1 Tax=Siminovitchia fortis TaxID=254758 RepID=A0A443IS76_9BACI|nr:DnaD domain-containing protein [Siminovitchia fortis]RWR10412.1 DnaD domain protein [Siminovitchia fortis]WHY82911.1 DnaD domain-containing protein [Siminovitchia fortis]